MRAKEAYLLVLTLSLLLADVSASISSEIFKIPSWLRKLRTPNSSWISNAWNKVSSVIKSHNGRLRIGDTVDGLSKIQDYLQLLGYLNSTFGSNGTYTPEVQSAIESFQKSYDLPVTGQLDNDTVSLLESPRCALPDFVNGSTVINSMNESRATYDKKWWSNGKRNFTYAFSADNDTTSFRGVFADAFSLWSKETALNFTETTSFNESDIRILFVTMDGKLGVVGGGSLDDTGASWDLLLDADEDWDNATASDDLNLESEVMHQIGHALGLTHSSVQHAVMYPYVEAGTERKVDFAKDDCERIQNSSDIGGNVSVTCGVAGAAGLGPRWPVLSSLGLGITLLFCL